MSLFRERRGLFLPWSRLERPRQHSTGLSHPIRWEEADVYLTSVFLLLQEPPGFSHGNSTLLTWDLTSRCCDWIMFLPRLSIPWNLGTERVHRWRTGCVQTIVLLAPAFASTKPKCALSPYFLFSPLLHIFLTNWRCFHSPWVCHPPSAHSPNGSGLIFGFVSKVYLNPACTACLWWRHCPLG